jgi:hypothetical protein
MNLIAELRRMRPVCWDAAEDLGMAVVLVPSLPVGAVFAANLSHGVLVCLADSEWSVWAGVAHCLANDLGIEASQAAVLEAAAVMCRKSGVIFLRNIG